MFLLTAPADESHRSSLSASTLPTLFPQRKYWLWLPDFAYFTFFPPSIPPNSSNAVIYITNHIFQGIKSQWKTCVPGDVLWWNLTKMNTWNAELKQGREQGGKPDESDLRFLGKQRILSFWGRDLRKNRVLVFPCSMNVWLKSHNLIYIWIITSICFQTLS